MKEIMISSQEEHQRLDKYLKKYFKAAGSSFLYKMLRKKNITLNERKATGAEYLENGDLIQVYFSDETFDKMRGLSQSNSEYEQLKSIPYDVKVIYEDDDILVLDKPAGILSQKAAEDDISMNEKMLSYLIHSNQLTGEAFETFHPSIANRLDRNTSGLLLAGKSLRGQQMLSKALRERTAEKYYQCIVKGHICEGMDIQGYLTKDEKSNKVSIDMLPSEDGKKIITSYEPICSNGTYTLLVVHLITGRTHQIRAHLASIGHPILGDPKYGDRKLNIKLQQEFGITHQLLHAYRMELDDGRIFESPTPTLYNEVLK
ncbi:MAG: RluA family pseudouridine synthase [Lachnospiraceae bacterium]|nr:RluA family pseudouridine synthase [Lachnospiraceae bacterium]